MFDFGYWHDDDDGEIAKIVYTKYVYRLSVFV